MSCLSFTPRALLPALFIAALLPACERETMTVAWYREHDAERMERIRECKANPDKLGKAQDCVNAKQAHREMLNGG